MQLALRVSLRHSLATTRMTPSTRCARPSSRSINHPIRTARFQIMVHSVISLNSTNRRTINIRVLATTCSAIRQLRKKIAWRSIREIWPSISSSYGPRILNTSRVRLKYDFQIFSNFGACWVRGRMVSSWLFKIKFLNSNKRLKIIKTLKAIKMRVKWTIVIAIQQVQGKLMPWK